MRRAQRTARATLAFGFLALGAGTCDAPSTEPTAIVATVQVSAATDTATAFGTTVPFTAVARDAAGFTIAGKAATWTSTAPTVATINPATGVATTSGNGSTNIQATVDGVSGVRTLVVVQEVASVTVSPATSSLNAGATQQFTATARDGNGSTVAGVTFLWVSSNANVAVVDTTGLARGIGRGDATITAAGRGHPGHAVLSVLVPAGRLVVASTSDNAVYLYDPVTLARLSTFSVTAPHSAAVGPDGRIYAGTPGGQIIAIHPVTGETATLGVGLLAGTIYGTTVSAGGVIYASGSGMDAVRTMDLEGTSLGDIVSPAGTNHRASAFGPDGSFYLTSFAGEPVQRWFTGFVYAGSFGATITAAFGIATRANGDVIVTDQNQHAYFRFSREGVFLGSVNIDCMGQVRNLAVDQDDNLWVGCYGANAVVKFDTRDREVARLTVNTPSGVAFERP